ncbi:hypothetical protein [Mucilaginibacter agri]|uniref:Uncharacterized protein n=1 Tax=Mucilaginibacter agri TaxID=2695265 RepID=A0A966DVI0_9SPHI|nr:hypothetical protein [Mucilaginibacter agri]NCD71467.1 hypothetical protein [Mucilaginibacter agri]
MTWNYTILLVCLVLAIFAVWREIQRESKRNLALRIVAVLCSIGALACIALPITYQHELRLEDENQVVLLTDGYNADSVIDADARVYTISKKIKKDYPKATLLASVSEISDLKPAVTSVQVLGYGLSADELAQLHNLPVKFHPTIPPAGISAVSWNTQVKSGEKLSVQGTFANTTGKAVKLTLKGLGTTADSTFIAANTTATFDLNTTPKHTGRAVYRLISTSDADTLANESVPFEITAVKPLKVLMLAAAPNFEDKFLKNWLSANGYGVAVRSMISKDKFSQEFVNVEQQSLQHLTTGLLDKFDIVLSDLDVLKNLNSAESAALKQEVQQKGVGIIVRADSTTHSNFWLQQNFPVNKVSSAGQVISSLKLQGHDGTTSKTLLDPVYIVAQNFTQPLVTDQQNHIMASSGLIGSGREIFTTLTSTHSWMLGGDEADYTALWSLLISKAAKHVPAAEEWSVVNNVASVNNNTKLQVETGVANPEIKINQTNISTERQAHLPFAWQADYWPSHVGWQQVQQGSGMPHWWFAYPQQEWAGLKYRALLKESNAYATNHHNGVSVTKQIQQKVQVPVSKIYFYVLLLLACTYLWAEGKFSS